MTDFNKTQQKDKEHMGSTAKQQFPGQGQKTQTPKQDKNKGGYAEKTTDRDDSGQAR